MATDIYGGQDPREMPRYSQAEVTAILGGWTPAPGLEIEGKLSFLDLVTLFEAFYDKRTVSARVVYGADGQPTTLYPLMMWEVTDPDLAPMAVAINPRLAFGAPVVAGTGVRVAAVAGRIQGADSVQDVAVDFGVDVATVSDVLRMMGVI